MTGGAGSVRAEYGDLERLAVYNDETAGFLTSVVLHGHSVLASPDLLASAVLNPGGVAKVESLLFEALNGSGGITGLALTVTERAAQIRLALFRYQATDTMIAGSMQALDSMLGAATIPAALTGIAGLAMSGPMAPFLIDQIKARGPDAAMKLITEHPGIADHLIRGLPSTLTGPFLGSMIDPLTASRLLAGAYPDSPGNLTATGVEESDLYKRPPAELTDLLERLDYRNENKGPENGQIDVQLLRAPDGTVRSVIVDLPGTDTWDFMPGNQHDSGSLNDIPTNLHGINGETTSYERMVEKSIRAAIGPPGPGSPPIMLVGHSQGGIIAAATASHSEYNITHVITAGSPVGNIDVPAHTQTLSLENNSDVVPHLDTRDNADVGNHTTVTFDIPGQAHDPGIAHGIANSYIPAAQALDHSTDSSISAFRDSAGAFLDTPAGTTNTTFRYYASRNPADGAP